MRLVLLLLLASCGSSPKARPEPTPATNSGGADEPPPPARLSVEDVRSDLHLDAERGVIVIEFTSGGGADEAKETKSAIRVCGNPLEQEDFGGFFQHHFASPYEPRCQPDGERTVCHSDGLGEYDVDVDLIFAPGPYLEAAIVVERATMAQQWIDEAEQFVAENLTRLRKEACP